MNTSQQPEPESVTLYVGDRIVIPPDAVIDEHGHPNKWYVRRGIRGRELAGDDVYVGWG